jgi:hypothetical protein
MDMSNLTHTNWFSREMLHQGLNGGQMALERVATILERTVPTTIQDWYERAVLDEKLMAVSMSREMRCSHLRRIFCDLVFRLRSPAISGKERAVL